MPEPVFDVIVCGSLHLDIMVHGAPIPRLDETAVGNRWEFACGGKGGNQAVQAAAAGATTAMIGRVGPDDFGKRLLAHLDKRSVHRGEVLVDPATGSGMSVAIVNDAGDYGAVIVSGSNLQIDPDGAPDAWRRLGGGRVLLLQNEVPEAVNLAMAMAGRAAGAIVVLNAAPVRCCSPALLALVDLLVVNRIEAAELAGTAVSEPEDAVAVLPALGSAHRRVVVTLGAQGLVASEPGGRAEIIPAQAVRVVSSHGAGDCFVGALAAGLAARRPFHQACADASRAAAAYVSAPSPC